MLVSIRVKYSNICFKFASNSLRIGNQISCVSFLFAPNKLVPIDVTNFQLCFWIFFALWGCDWFVIQTFWHHKTFCKFVTPSHQWRACGLFVTPFCHLWYLVVMKIKLLEGINLQRVKMMMCENPDELKLGDWCCWWQQWCIVVFLMFLLMTRTMTITYSDAFT